MILDIPNSSRTQPQQISRETRGRIFSRAGNELGTSLIMTVPYTSCLARSQLVSSTTKNTASVLLHFPFFVTSKAGLSEYHFSHKLYRIKSKENSLIFNKLETFNKFSSVTNPANWFPKSWIQFKFEIGCQSF